MKISRKKLNLEIIRYLKNGGKITKLPDGPDYRFQPYGARVTPGDPIVDLTITDSPTTKQQIKYVEENSLWVTHTNTLLRFYTTSRAGFARTGGRMLWRLLLNQQRLDYLINESTALIVAILKRQKLKKASG